jgi:hypothetical protein
MQAANGKAWVECQLPQRCWVAPVLDQIVPGLAVNEVLDVLRIRNERVVEVKAVPAMSGGFVSQLRGP